MDKKIHSILLAAIFTVTTFNCTSISNQNPSAKPADRSFPITVALPADLPSQELSAIAEISGTDFDTIRQSLTIGNSIVSGTIEKVPLGLDRTITLKLFNADNVLIYRGTGEADVLSDEPVNIMITLIPVYGSIVVTGTLQVVDTSDKELFTDDENTVFHVDFNTSFIDQISGSSGTVTAGSFVTALFGAGLKLDPPADKKALYLFPATSRLNITTLSMEALVFTEQVTGGFMHIIDKGYLYVLTANNGNLSLYTGNSWWNSSVKLPVEKWSYLCGTLDGATARLYLNGEQVDATAYSERGDTAFNLGIGNSISSSHDIPFFGIIDEVRISKSVRTPAEIAETWMIVKKRFDN